MGDESGRVESQSLAVPRRSAPTVSRSDKAVGDDGADRGDDIVEPAAAADHSLAMSLITASRQFSGPLPPATELAAYNKVLPGAAERIVVMAEREQKNRHEVGNSLVQYRFFALKVGAGLTCAALGLFAYAIYAGAAWGYPAMIMGEAEEEDAGESAVGHERRTQQDQG
ncbi:MAG: DUF2335 domain-containing protein [Nannocystaceae bacterium]